MEKLLTRAFSDLEIKKLKELINEGVQTSSEVDMLKDALSDTVKTIAEELDIKPTVLNRTIRSAYKSDIREKKESLDEVEDILDAVGRNH